jgi:eukaryotic-like serine/threonine-protein kinase
MSSASSTLKASQVIGQRYVILRPMREEPWGEVYLAQDRLLKVEVGLKFISQETPEFDLARSILVREAAMAYRLRHPLILAVFHGSEDREGFYLVQEPHLGESLLARLNRLERVSLSQGLHVLDQVARAVAFAHEQGVVHQGLNPLNVLMEADRVKVANFACPSGEEDQVGSLELKAYASPEVVRGEEVTPQANVFSLGVLGFRLTAGSLPYPLTFDESFPYRLEAPPPDLEEIPIPLQNLLLGCLGQEPDDRYPDFLAFLAALEQSRELLHAVPREKRFLWQPKAGGVSVADSAKAAAKKLWEEGRAQAGKWAEKLKPAAAQTAEKVRSAPRRLLWGLGLGLLTVLLIWVGAKALKREAAAPRPETAREAPPLPVVGGPPQTALQPRSSTRAPTTPGPAATASSSRTPQPPAGVAAPAPDKTEKYLVLVASYTQLKHAQALQNRLKTHNIQAKAVRTSPGGKTVYQVRVGPLAGKKEADATVRLIKEREGISAKVVEVSSGPSTSSTKLRRRQ